MSYFSGVELRTYINKWKSANEKKLNDLVILTGIDQALLSKYMGGKRMPSEKDLVKLSLALDIPYSELRKSYLADKIIKMLEYEPNAAEILAVAESRVEYLNSKEVFNLPELSSSLKKKLSRIDKLKEKWSELKPLNFNQLSKLNGYFRVKYTYESNRIEGNTLTYQETHLVINEGLTIGGKSMNDHLEAINHNEAVHWLAELVSGDEDMNKRNVLDLHRLILKSIDSSNAGIYRKIPVRISGSQHEPPEPYLLEKLMEDYFSHYSKQRRILHPVILAAEAHERLVSIHPFTDGNGRTSRLVMNFVLLRNGFTLANLKGDDKSRLEYYKALEDVQVNNKPEPFYHLIADKVIESLEEHLKMV